MGARINMENDIAALRKELEELRSENEQLKTAFNGLASTVETLEMSSTVRKNIDLHEKPDARNIKTEGKKPKKTKKEDPEVIESLL